MRDAGTSCKTMPTSSRPKVGTRITIGTRCSQSPVDVARYSASPRVVGDEMKRDCAEAGQQHRRATAAPISRVKPAKRVMRGGFYRGFRFARGRTDRRLICSDYHWQPIRIYVIDRNRC